MTSTNYPTTNRGYFTSYLQVDFVASFIIWFVNEIQGHPLSTFFSLFLLSLLLSVGRFLLYAQFIPQLL